MDNQSAHIPPIITLSRSLYATTQARKGEFPLPMTSERASIVPGPLANYYQSQSSASSHTSTQSSHITSGSICSCSSCARLAPKRSHQIGKSNLYSNTLSNTRLSNTSSCASTCSCGSSRISISSCSCSSCANKSIHSCSSTSCSCSSCPYHSIGNTSAFYGGSRSNSHERSINITTGDAPMAEGGVRYLPPSRMNVSDAMTPSQVMTANVSVAISAFEDLLQEAMNGERVHLGSMGPGLGMGAPLQSEMAPPSVPELLFPFNNAILNATIISDSRNISLEAADGRDTVPVKKVLAPNPSVIPNPQEITNVPDHLTLIDALVQRLRAEKLISETTAAAEAPKDVTSAGTEGVTKTIHCEAATSLSESFLAAVDAHSRALHEQVVADLTAQHTNQLELAHNTAATVAVERDALLANTEDSNAKVAALEAQLASTSQEVVNLKIAATGEQSAFALYRTEATLVQFAAQVQLLELLEAADRSEIIRSNLQSLAALTAFSELEAVAEPAGRAAIAAAATNALGRLLWELYHEDGKLPNQHSMAFTERPVNDSKIESNTNVPSDPLPSASRDNHDDITGDAQPMHWPSSVPTVQPLPQDTTTHRPHMNLVHNESFSSGYDDSSSDEVLQTGGDRYGVATAPKKHSVPLPSIASPEPVNGNASEEGLVGTPSRHSETQESSTATNPIPLSGNPQQPLASPTKEGPQSTDAVAFKAVAMHTSIPPALSQNQNPFDLLRQAIDAAAKAVDEFVVTSPPQLQEEAAGKPDSVIDALFVALREADLLRQLQQKQEEDIQRTKAKVLRLIHACSEISAETQKSLQRHQMFNSAFYQLIEEETRARYGDIICEEKEQFLEIVRAERVRFGALLVVEEGAKAALAAAEAQRYIGRLEQQLVVMEKDLATAVNARTKLMQVIMKSESGLVQRLERPALAPVVVSNIPIHERFARAHQEAMRVVSLQHYPHEDKSN